MDWNTFLFAARWGIIALFYLVLFILLAGVYREAGQRVTWKSGQEAVSYGRLRVIHPGNDPRVPAGTVFHLRTETRVGAGQDNDIVLRDQYVSRHHLRLRWDGAVWWLEDLNSRNGTLVNRRSFPPGSPQTIARGAVIQAGDAVLELIE